MFLVDIVLLFDSGLLGYPYHVVTLVLCAYSLPHCLKCRPFLDVQMNVNQKRLKCLLKCFICIFTSKKSFEDNQCFNC